jgi:hypothetical protein
MKIEFSPSINIFLVLFGAWCCAAKSASYSEADIAEKGKYILEHKHKANSAKVDVSVTKTKRQDPSQSIGNYNELRALKIEMNGEQLAMPRACRVHTLKDISYVRLDDDGKNIRFWIQGGDASEAYQVAFYLEEKQAVKCRFFPSKNQIAIEPMMSKKTLDSLKGKIKQ